MHQAADRGGRARTRAPWLRAAVLVGVLAGAALFAWRMGLFQYRDPARLAAELRAAREHAAAAPLFVLVYAAATALALPGSALTLAGGAVFGFALGALLNWLGATLGATAAYALARWLGRDAAHGLLGRRGASLDRLASEHGFLALLRLRLIPVVPFNALNFAAGFAGVRVRDYVLATALGILPGTLVYTYFASALVAGASGARRHALLNLLLAGALLVLLSFLPAIARRLGWIRSAASCALLAACAAPGPSGAQRSGGALVTGTARMDHSAFDALLHRDVVNGMVDYDAFARAPEFQSYLAALDRTDPSTLTRDEQLAYWINAYNAYTIQLINEHHERESIRNVNKSLGLLKLKGPWNEPLVRVGGKRYTLDQVEHEIIRPRFGEPRIHFALVCAAMGCPPLRSEAYVGDRLSRQLDNQADIFINHSPTKNRVDVANRVFHHSMIFRYYKQDFGGTDAAVGRYVARFMPPGPARQVLESGDFTMDETDYDWTLNSQEQARRRAATAATP